MNQDPKHASLIMESEKSKSDSNFWVTIFTPTYNRKGTIKRTYESICNLIPSKRGGMNGL